MLICPLDERPTFGPLVGYALANDSIFTRHLGAKPHERNPSMWQGDSSQEFFFVVQRDDQRVTGPLTLREWDNAGLPAISSIQWVKPKNPNFWTPLLGDLIFLGFIVVQFGWPVIVVLLALWAFRRIRQKARAAA